MIRDNLNLNNIKSFTTLKQILINFHITIDIFPVFLSLWEIGILIKSLLFLKAKIDKMMLGANKFFGSTLNNFLK